MLKGTRSIFYAAYRSWRERWQRGELWRFSRRPLKEDSRSRLARLVDLCGTLLLVWISSLFLLNILGAGLLTPFAATAITAAVGAMATRLQQKRYRAELPHRRSRTDSGCEGAGEGEGSGSPGGSPKGTPCSTLFIPALKRTALRREKSRPYLLTGTFLLACRLILGPQLPASGLYFFLAAANLALGLACLVCGAKETGPPERFGLQEP